MLRNTLMVAMLAVVLAMGAGMLINSKPTNIYAQELDFLLAESGANALPGFAQGNQAERFRPGDRPGDRRGNRRENREALAVRQMVRVTADLTGQTPQEVVDALQDGQTLAAIAAANGSSGDAVVAEAISRLEAMLDRGVANGRITRQQADTLIDEATERANELVNDDTLGQQIEEHRREHVGEHGGLAALMVGSTADLTGLTIADVVDALQDGDTLAEIAAANGSSGNAVVADVTTQAEERLSEAVADGRLTQEEADRVLQQMTERANELVNDATLGEQVESRIEQAMETMTRMVLLRGTAEVTDLREREILLRLRTGETLAAIAEAEGHTSDEVIDAALSLAETRLDQLVAEGLLSQAEADECLETIGNNAETMVNEPRLGR